MSKKKIRNTLEILKKQRKELLYSEKNLRITKIDNDKTILALIGVSEIKKKDRWSCKTK